MRRTHLIRVCVLSILLLTPFSILNLRVVGQPAIDEPWFPPSEFSPGGLPSGILFYDIAEFSVAPGTSFTARFEDSYGRTRDRFCESDLIYFVFYTSCQGWLFIVEYYPPGSVPDRHWLIYGLWIPAGYWKLGPFIAEPTEPEGLHSWRVFFWCPPNLIDQIYRFTFERTPNVIQTSCFLTVTPDRVYPGHLASISASITPSVPGGTLTISVSVDGISWTTLTSGPASSGSLTTTYTPLSTGVYYFQVKYSGYTYTAPGKKDQYSESYRQATLIVEKIPTTLFLTVPSSTYVGDTIPLSGSISPAFSGGQVIINILGPETQTKYVSIQNGQFGTSCVFTKAGKYSVQAIFNGDEAHGASQSQVLSLEVMKKQTTLSLSVSPSEGSIDVLTKVATEIKVIGRIEPYLSVPIEIKITHPDGSIEFKNIQSSTDGQFSLPFAPRASGLCRIEARFLGTDQYEGSLCDTTVSIQQNYMSLITLTLVVLVAIGVGIFIIYKKKAKPLPPPP